MFSSVFNYMAKTKKTKKTAMCIHQTDEPDNK